MTESLDEREQLIADLLEEAHGLRMKLEDFSLYTESKVAEFVLARNQLTKERDDAVHAMSLATQDMLVLRQRQDQLHQQLIHINSRIAKLTSQRDRARERVKALESSRAVRLAERLRKLRRR
jgi:outer membrane murein-binding lipoprotein Lpp|nr:hypothetical protein [Acidobacteriota bacterium]